MISIPRASASSSLKPCLASCARIARRFASYRSRLAASAKALNSSAALAVAVSPTGRSRENKRERNSARSADSSISALSGACPVAAPNVWNEDQAGLER